MVSLEKRKGVAITWGSPEQMVDWVNRWVAFWNNCSLIMCGVPLTCASHYRVALELRSVCKYHLVLEYLKEVRQILM